MNKYEKLLDEAFANKVDVDENYKFKGHLHGLYIDGNIALSDELENTAQKSCVLAEELGHHYTSSGHILDVSNAQNAKQERQARIWAYNSQIGLEGLISAFEEGCRTQYEIAEFLDVTEAFLKEAIEYYRDKYGTFVTYDNYDILLIPNLAVRKHL